MTALNRYEKRLVALREEVCRLRDQHGMLAEQVAYVEGVADDARIKALAAATPLAERERGVAEEELRRATAQRDEVVARLEELLTEQDRLLEQLHVRG